MNTELLTQLKGELHDTELKIKKHEPQNEYTARVASAFHLGLVGSGRNTYRLNKRREREIDKTIERAKILTPLYQKRNNLKQRIEYIESGKEDQKQDKIMKLRIAKAEFWRRLKPGDEIPLGNSNGNPKVKIKNRLSVISDGLNVKYTAAEIIGREAAKLI